MRTQTIVLAGSLETLCHTAWIAEHPHQRTRGLLFRPRLNTGEGLLLRGVSSIHTIGMRYPLDVVFIGADLEITALCARLAPMRMSFGPKRTRHALELPPGTIYHHGMQAGDHLLTKAQLVAGPLSPLPLKAASYL